ncbi:MAG: hypothetical protein RL563_385, partial [Pseudomonadota bacterium]
KALNTYEGYITCQAVAVAFDKLTHFRALENVGF